MRHPFGGRPKSLVFYVYVALWLLVTTRSAQAQRDLKDIPPPDPELERATLQLPEGFEVNLFAADPAIAKPIQMNFDPQGRLWIAMSEVYPHIKPGQEANDKILILEDTDGDGRSDSTKVFVDGLLIPTGVAPGDGGAYVANSTQLLHFADSDGDGLADRKKVVLSGFGTEDTHHILHTLRWGPDGRLYFNQSIYIHSHIETPWGVRRLNGGGIWRFFPPADELEVHARGFINTWGHHFDAVGQSFATDGAGGEGINYVIPGAAYVTAVGAPRTLPGLNPGSPKYCGLEIVSGRQLPADWQGNLITADFRGHRVCRFRVVDDGAGFASKQLGDLVSSNHVAFRPIDIKMGPDGAIYIADWYNPIIQHGEVDFRDPRRDHTHGRIWRITYKGNAAVPRPAIVSADVPTLFAQLNAPEGWTREQTRRELQERGPVLKPQLDAWVASLSSDDTHADSQRLEALWIYESWNTPAVDLLNRVIASASPQIRAAGMRVLSHWSEQIPDAQQKLAVSVLDPHPRVRLEAVRGLSRIRQPSSIVLAMRAFDQLMDPFLDYALWLAARDLQDVWVSEIASGGLAFDGPHHLYFAVNATDARGALPAVLRALQQTDLPEDQTDRLLQLVARMGGATESAKIFQDAVSLVDSDPERATRLLSVLEAAGRQRGVKPQGDLVPPLQQLLRHSSEEVQLAAIHCAGAWQVTPLRPELTRAAVSGDQNPAVRTAAYSSLSEIGGPESEMLLLEQSRTATPLALRAEALIVLIPLDAKSAAGELSRLLNETTDTQTVSRVFETFLSQKNGMALLAAGLAKDGMPADAAKVALRLVNASGRPDAALVANLSKTAGMTGQPRKLSPAEMEMWVARVQQSGNAAHGEEVFRREAISCLKCHAVGGAGGRVGPDIVSLGGSAQVDYLVESLFDPNAKVKENYHTLVVVDQAGKIYSGVKTGQTDTDLILRDAEDREIRIPLDSIDEQAVGVSLMPAGLGDRLTQQELTDLVRFLSEVGRTPQFKISPRQLARRWEVMQPTKQAQDRLRRTRDATAASDDATYIWKPIYSRVNGQLPIAELPILSIRNKSAPGERHKAFVRAEFEVSTPQPAESEHAQQIVLTVNKVVGLDGWLDGETVELSPEMHLAVTPGRHRLTLAIDTDERDSDLQLELLSEPNSSAAVRWIIGQ